MTDAIEPRFREMMNNLAQGLDVTFNGHPPPPPQAWDKPVGFVLLTFNFGDNVRVNYISNAEREDMIAAMKAFLARAEGQPDVRGQA